LPTQDETPASTIEPAITPIQVVPSITEAVPVAASPAQPQVVAETIANQEVDVVAEAVVEAAPAAVNLENEPKTVVTEVAPVVDLNAVLADSGLVMVQTTAALPTPSNDAPVKLGRPRKTKALDASVAEPLMMVETQK
jgi:ribonuclease E